LSAPTADETVVIAHPVERLVQGHRRRLGQMPPAAAEMARTLMWIILAGAAFGLIGSLVLPASAREVTGTLIISLVACAVAGILFVVPHRIPPWGYQAILALGTVGISVGIWVNGRATSDDEMFYLWGVLFVFYYFSRRQAVVQMGLVAAGYAAALIAQGGDLSQAAVRWLVTLGGLGVAGLVVVALRDRATRQIRRLAVAARTDALTGLLDRSGFEGEFAAAASTARRAGSRVSLLMADLDHFKQVNDRFGHDAGDRALQRVAELLRDRSRAGDRAARLGGEEFALIVPDSGPEQAVRMAERLRDDVRAAFADDAVPITVSVGVAVYPDDAADLTDLVRTADRGLYAAKRAGRDRVSHAPDPNRAVQAAAVTG